MYFAAIVHQKMELPSATAVAEAIHGRNIPDYAALSWQTSKGEFCAVADGGINDPWLEVAIINLSTNTQIESLTFGWAKDLEEKISLLNLCETSDFVMGAVGQCRVPFSTDEDVNDIEANFTCGCCGAWFTSKIGKQLSFDQDAGYGICDPCVKRFR